MHIINNQTLSDCINDTHKAQHETAEASQHLNNAQKNTVMSGLSRVQRWATPSHPHNLQAYMLDLTRKLPGTNWPYRYLKENNNVLKVLKPQHLDPKHAQNFN